MKQILYIFSFLISLTLFSQEEKVSVLTDTDFSNRWITLSKDWRYQKGDNLDWAKPEFDDSLWKQFSSVNLNMPDSIGTIAGDNEIVWFRKRIKADSTLQEALVLNIYQQGASEIYLDGKLIHKIGTVSSKPDALEIYNPRGTFLSLPKLNGKEQVLAIRYANGQYKLPKNRRYPNTNGYIGLTLTSLRHANSSLVLTLTDSLISDQWLSSRFWRYQKGDNPNWADPNFDDSAWLVHGFSNLNYRNGENIIADPGEIAWFRKHIKGDSALTKTTVLNISQRGASEIYLDGKLIHQFGKVSSNKDEVVYYNPSREILQLPLEKGKEQVLAVRYVNARDKLPLIEDNTGDILLWTSSLKNANSLDITKNNRIAESEKALSFFHIALGIGILIFIIFLSYFLFFPKERINGIFALSTIFLLAFFFLVIYDFGYNGPPFWLSFLSITCVIIWGILNLYCFYLVLEHKFDIVFKLMITISVLSIGLMFIYKPSIIVLFWSTLLFFDTLRISIRSWNKNRIGSIIFILTSSILLLFYIFTMLSFLLVLYNNSTYIVLLLPISFMLLPISLAIYLGLAFGKKSQQLRLNLERIQSLSKEKESILSQQKVKLEQQVKERTNSLNTSLENLKATQSQLIQSEKMASLGELTAGIAHEIQNPLNFVNNFSELNKELVLEANEEFKNKDYEEVKAILKDIESNSEKINHHGKRADSIVKGMLQHSRASNNKKEPTDINALADEYLRLAYHGLRAKDKSFNAQLVTDFDDSIDKIKVIPQDLGRVILNLLTNAFYVINEKQKRGIENYNPTVSISTKKIKDHIEIEVRDNGNGMTNSVMEKIFQPFFTTKPTGQGTGLGLSMSYDIITKGHNGELKVITKEGEGTTFCISLPI
jgi:signal transduction histidine kinase